MQLLTMYQNFASQTLRTCLLNSVTRLPIKITAVLVLVAVGNSSPTSFCVPLEVVCLYGFLHLIPSWTLKSNERLRVFFDFSL